MPNPTSAPKLNVLVFAAAPSLAGGNHGLCALRMPLERPGTRSFPDVFSPSMAHKAFTERVG